VNQATFGATQADVDAVISGGYSAWFKSQIGAAQTSAVTDYLTKLAAATQQGQGLDMRAISDFAYRAQVDQPDQLRQRMVFALSQILVVSLEDPGVQENLPAMAAYIDVLNKNAFGDYRNLLEDVTYSPAMALYLTYINNEKEDAQTGQVPDENYARELMQLFTIGLVELNDDGTPKTNPQGQQIETYTNADITGLAKVFTGLSWDDSSFGGRTADREKAGANYAPLKMWAEEHSLAEKKFLGKTIPANTEGVASIDQALDALMAHPNIAPFISKQMIQRFVTSNPSNAYVKRVTDAFNAGAFVLPDRTVVGKRTKGDLAATLAAVLFDVEARDLSKRNDVNFGRVREPVLRFAHWARVADVNSPTVLAANGLTDNWTAANANAPEALGQMQWRSPSVFNFYRPGYVAAGSSTAAAGLVAPELQIFTTTAATGYANYMRSFIQNANQTSTFLPSYAAEVALADRPDALVDRLNLLMTSNSLSTENRARIVAAVNAVSLRQTNLGEDLRNRVNLATLMIALTPEFIVQR
ncbi:MAG: DUF1800 domain-containing protein, partial [Parvularculaceae bacterium]|nr:DUF1800 domain-containing protein [Parvularculaceae bacterium]